jgi:hypothetical protein
VVVIEQIVFESRVLDPIAVDCRAPARTVVGDDVIGDQSVGDDAVTPLAGIGIDLDSGLVISPD